MRLVIDSLIVVMLLAVLGGVVILHSNRKQDERDLTRTQQALSALHAQTAYQSTVQSAMAGHEQVLVYIDPAWFGDDTPVNALAGGDRPWLDLAPPGDLNDHPPDPIILDGQQAAFWYNPTLGVFRARVQPQLSEAKTLELYNKVNTSALLSFDPAASPDRRPMAHVPGQPPSRQYASLAAGWDNAAPAPAAERTPGSPAQVDVPQEPAALPTEASAPASVPAEPARPRLGDPVPQRPAVIHELGTNEEPEVDEQAPWREESPAIEESPYPETPEPPGRPTLRR